MRWNIDLWDWLCYDKYRCASGCAKSKKTGYPKGKKVEKKYAGLYQRNGHLIIGRN